MTWLRHPFSPREKVSRHTASGRTPVRSDGLWAPRMRALRTAKRASRANPHPYPSPHSPSRNGRPPGRPMGEGKKALLLAAHQFSSVLALAVQPDEVMKDPALETRARALSGELRCLVCQNEFGSDDPEAPLARDIRILIRERIGKGEKQQIRGARLSRLALRRFHSPLKTPRSSRRRCCCG